MSNREDLELDLSDPPWRDPDLPPMGRMAALAGSMGSQGVTALRRSAGRIEAPVEKELSAFVRNGPKNLAKVAVEAVAQVADDLAEEGRWSPAALSRLGARLDAPGFARVASALRLEAMDPQNAEEAAEALEAVGGLMAQSPALKKLGGEALAELQDAGVLGDSLMAQVLEWLLVASVTSVVVARAVSGQLELQAGPLSLSVDKVGNYNARISLVNPSWIAKKLKLGVLGKRGQLHTAGASAIFRLPAPPSTELSASPEVAWSRSGGASLGLSSSMKLPAGRSSFTVSPYASAELRSEGEREAGLRLTTRFGQHPSDASMVDRPVALLASLLLVGGLL
jgi:hypothetical protein